jgi:hypothetical protein
MFCKILAEDGVKELSEAFLDLGPQDETITEGNSP